MKVLITIPAYNEEQVIAEVIENIKKNGFEQILVIDDGSNDHTAMKAANAGAKVIRHCINRGLGGAIGTGFEAAKNLQADIIVTLDADGQHSPEEIKNLIKPIIDGEAQVVLGSRLYKNTEMPFSRRIFNKIGNIVTYFFFGLKVTDSQSGFRAFSKETLEKINIKSDHMEVSSELIREIKKNKFIFKEIPIKAIYTDYSLSKGQNFLLGIKTFFKLFLHYLKK